MEIKESTETNILAYFLQDLQDHHHQLAPAIFQKMSTADAQQLVTDLLNNSSHHFYVAYNDKKLAGVLWLEEIPVRDNGLIRLDKSLHVAGIVTKKGFRKQGVAQALLTHAEKIAKDKGYAQLTLDFWALNGLETFYHKHGYETYKYQMRKPLD